MLLVERKNTLPIVLHADHDPTVLVRFSHQSLGKSADVSIRKTAARAIGVLARCVVVMHQHHQVRAIARLRPFQHLGIASGIAEGRGWMLADEKIDADGLARTVINEEYFRLA